MKYIYRIIGFIFVFSISVFLMGNNIKEAEVDLNTTIDMKNATFPVLILKTGEHTMNLLHGYSSAIAANVIRESITPVDINKSLEVIIEENESIVKKIKYEVREIKQNGLIDSGTINALEKYGEEKKAIIKIKGDLVPTKEYAVRITVVTDVSRKIHYYTRIKYYTEDSYFKEKLDFVMDFHKMAMEKDKEQKLASYLEPNSSQDNSNLANVTIHSSHDLVCWGKLEPKVITTIIPTIKELNIETASILLQYQISAQTASGTEIYQVKEFYRVRYTSDRFYLLSYQRNMEAEFDASFTSLTKNELKIGITNQKNLQFVMSASDHKLSFVRERELWYYNLAENTVIRVFSFLQDTKDYVRNGYDQHDIRILNMDDSGNIDFVVYGYMNRGDYEGRVGIVLYKFFADERRIEERVYIPMEVPYSILKFDLDSFSYVSEKDIYYFSIYNIVYAYNISSKKLNILAEGISEGDYLLSTEGGFIAWQNSSTPSKATTITILDLETEKRYIIEAPKGDNIKVLAGIDSNMVFGFVHSNDIIKQDKENWLIPLYKVQIINKKGKVLKNHQMKNKYVTKVEVRKNIIELERMKKKESNGKISYVPAKADHLINIEEENDVTIELTTRVTERTLTEYYLSLPYGFTIDDIPIVERTVNTVITDDRTLNLTNNTMATLKYYVYALGDVIAAYSNEASAIILADENMGTVIDSQNRIIWERGGKYNRNTIQGIEIIKAGNGVTSIDACISMVLKLARINVSVEKEKGTIYNILQKYMQKRILRLNGCSLDSVLYYVSNGKPVIAMKTEDQAVLLVGYDEYSVTIIDPQTGNSNKMLINNAQKVFENANNIFISYID